MTRYAYGTAMALLFLSLVPQAWGQQYFLYSPKPVAPEESKQAKDGILVREVAVRRGDTLYRISRKFSGHGMYYPQILLFNDIKNPNLIQVGDTLKVPVAGERAVDEESVAPVRGKKTAGRKQKAARKQQAVTRNQPAETTPATGQLTERSPSELKPAGKGRKKEVRKPPVVPAATKPAPVPKQAQRPVSADSAAGQRLFEQAIKAYRQDDCRTALDLFDRFLATYPASPQAADASLYKAECYMKLSR